MVVSELTEGTGIQRVLRTGFYGSEVAKRVEASFEASFEAANQAEREAQPGREGWEMLV